MLKGLLGVLEIAAHKGPAIEGSSSLTYYEPTANWVVMVALLGIVAAILARLRPPLWMLLGTPLLIASLLLSYRRSFWIAAALGLLLVVLLALSPVGRRLLVPTALFVAAGIWLLGSINFQSSQSPIVKRAASLSPSSLANNVEDRYRLDERANVLAQLEKKPITGLGILVPWEATERPLPVEHEEAREYVHFAALWWWMKMGILGLLAYLALLLATARLAWRVWRERTETDLQGFRSGLAVRGGGAAGRRDDGDLHRRGTSLLDRLRRADRAARAAHLPAALPRRATPSESPRARSRSRPEPYAASSRVSASIE